MDDENEAAGSIGRMDGLLFLCALGVALLVVAIWSSSFPVELGA